MNSLQIMQCDPEIIVNNDFIYMTLFFIFIFGVLSVVTYNILTRKNNDK